MTTTYVRLTDTDKPESQTAITASFVDENGKHVDIGGGTTTLTEENLANKGEVTVPSATPVGVYKDESGKLSVLCMKNSGIAKQTLSDIGHIYAITIPAIKALAAISTLETSATLPDVVNKVNEILNAVKNNL